MLKFSADKSACILDGRKVASEIKKDLKAELLLRQKQGLDALGLGVILLGDDPASCIYVNNKRKACESIGITSFVYTLPKKTSESELLDIIDALNNRDNIDGILVQLPLPPHIDTAKIIQKIKVCKDVDGFHPENFGRLAQGNPILRPCTPYGIIKLLEFYKIQLVSKHAVIVGASNIVGRPMALEFLHARSTVTICHSKTQNLEQHIRCADIIVIATGIPDVIDVSWLNRRQIIIDVGMQRLENGLVRGEVNFEHAKTKVAWITPVPGGVGPMTISILLQNTLLANQLCKNGN